MADELQVLSDSHSAEAAQAAAVHQEAIEKARQAQMMSVLEEFFQRGVEDKKFIDINRIPFICDDIRGIHSALKEINQNMDKMQPILQATAGGKLLYRTFLAMGSIAMGWIALKQTFGFL